MKDSAMRFHHEELASRLGRLQEALGTAGLDGALILQRADLVYYTDSVFQGALAVPAQGEAALFVWRGLGLVSPHGPAAPRPLPRQHELPAALLAAGFGRWKRVGYEEDVLPVAWWKRIGLAAWPDAEWVDVSTPIREHRSVKSAAELERVRQSGAVLSGGFEALRGLIREGMPEYEVQAELDLQLRRRGDQAGGRTRGFTAEARGVVACGPSASADTAFDGPLGQPGRYPQTPFGAGAGRIARHLPVIVDNVAGANGYLTDMTRTFCLGELPARFAEAHRFCVTVLRELTRRLVPGAIPEELYGWAVQEAEAAGYADGFMNRGANKVRFLGHGIGLELDELPILAKRFTRPLEAGMVIAVEPKIIFPDGSVGVEDTLVVREGGAEVVTPMPLEVIRLDDPPAARPSPLAE